MTSDRTPGLSSWIGVFAGPTGWFAAQQVGAWGVLPHCADHSAWVIAVNVAALLAVMGCGWISFRARGSTPPGSARGERVRFVAGLGVISAAVFGFAILLQMYAGLIFMGCER